MKNINDILQQKANDIAKITVIQHYPEMEGREFDVRMTPKGQGCLKCKEILVPLYEARAKGSSEWRRVPIDTTCTPCEDKVMSREDTLFKKRCDVEIKTRDYWRIPIDLENATLENYNKTDASTADALIAAKDYLDDWDANDRYSLIMRGSYGAGKSHLLKAVADEIRKKIKADDEPFLVGFIPMESVLTMIKSSWDDKTMKSHQTIIDELVDLDFLVLDDVGTEGTEFASRILFEIVNGRAGKPLGMTTNITDWDEFIKRFGANGGKLASKIRNNAKTVDIVTTDKRIRER